MRGQVSKRTIFAFIGPAVFGLAIVGIAPLLYAGWTSLHFFNLIKHFFSIWTVIELRLIMKVEPIPGI